MSSSNILFDLLNAANSNNSTRPPSGSTAGQTGFVFPSFPTRTPFGMASRVTTTTADPLEGLKMSLDEGFLITMAILVYFMQAGFAFLEAGSVRSKNTTNILLKNLLDGLIGCIVYWLFGFAFAFGPGNSFIGGWYFAGQDWPSYSQFFWQYVFAAAAASIVSGSLAERCSITAYFSYSTFLTGFLYPVVTHWAWSEEGWLAKSDFHDFAGSGVVHLVGGTCGLVGAILLGPRIGRFDPETGKVNDIKGHSIPLVYLGGFILLLGFLPFNGGSVGHISQAGDGHLVAKCVANTMISGSFGGVVVMILVKLGAFGTPRYFSALASMNGALTGMVAVCAGVNGYNPWGACVVGTVGAIAYIITSRACLFLHIDDPVDAVAVHFGGGLSGLLATPFLLMDNGIFMTGNHKSGMILAWNIAGACAIIAWSGALSLLLFGSLKILGMLRLDQHIEIAGMDLIKHGEAAYPFEGWLEEQYMRLEFIRTGAKPFTFVPPMMDQDPRGMPGNNLVQTGPVSYTQPTYFKTGVNNQGFINDKTTTNF